MMAGPTVSVLVHYHLRADWSCAVFGMDVHGVLLKNIIMLLSRQST